MALRIKRDDIVLVISGRHEDRGRRGRVLSIDPDKGTAIVEGIRIQKKHRKPRSQEDRGGIIEQEGPIALSNLMLCEAGPQGRAGRVSIRTDEQGNKVRVIRVRNEKTGEPEEVVVP